MSSVTNLGTILSQKYMLAALRDRMDDTQRQLGSGKISDSLADLGTLGASTAINYRNRTNTLDRYSENIKGSKTKLTVMDKAMGIVAEEARDVLKTLQAQLQNDDPKATILSDQARSALNNIVAKMNEQVSGEYVFAGDDFHTQPMNDPAALNANMAGLVAGWLTGTTPAAVIADARAETGTALGFSTNLMSAGNVSFLADENTKIDYTVRADNNGFSDVLRGLSIIANLPQPTTATETTNYWNVVNGVINLLDTGARAIDEQQGLLGNKAKLVDDLLVQHDEVQVAFKTFIGEVEDADMAEATTLFQTLQSQMQMSYNVIATMKDLSLVNYL